jgi:Uncharacterized protein conserved in bacteria
MAYGGQKLQSVVSKAAEVLKKGGVTADKPMSSKDLVAAVRAAINAGELDTTISDSTILQYISAAVNNDPDCVIASGGSWGGYWLKAVSAEVASVEPVPEVVHTSASGSFKEFDLYPLVSFWLESKKNYTAKDLSSLKGGGKWGNPDIVGVSRTDLFGSIEIELVSCEVKLSSSSWEMFIFEAISHKRFSNRSWYCYRVTDPNAPLPTGMEYYAERYKVGIVQIYMTDAELGRLKDTGDPLEFVDRVQERVPAVFEHVSLQEKKALVDRTSLTVALSFE